MMYDICNFPFSTVIPLLRKVTALTRPVSGEKQNYSGNLEILSGIFLGNMTQFWNIAGKKRSLTFLQGCHRKNWEDLPSFQADSQLHIVLFKQRLLSLVSI